MIGPARKAYKAAVDGESDEPPLYLYIHTQDVENRDEHVERAVEMVIRKRMGGKPDVPAWDYLSSVTDDQREHHALMRMTVYLAKQDPRYWGIEDPETQRYCSECRKVFDMERFPTNAPLCDDCIKEDE